MVNRYGIVGFVVMSVMCGCSKYIKYTMTPWPYGGFYVLVASRFLQGFFAAFLMANTMSMCGILVEHKDIATSMAMNAIAFSVANALGPPLGGVLVDFAGWEYCFFINVIFGIIALTMSILYLPKLPKFVEEGLDWFGGVLILLGFVALILGMTLIPPSNGK